MRKITKLIIAFTFATLLFAPHALAAGTDTASRQQEALGMDDIVYSLPDTASDILRGANINDSESYQTALSSVINGVSDSASGILKTGLRSAALIIAVSMITGLVCSLAEGTVPSGAMKFVPLAGILAVSIISFGDISTFIGLGDKMMGDISDFSKVLLPSLSAAAAASGAVTSAAAKCAAAMLFLDVLINVSQNVVMPLIYAYIAASAAGAAFGGKQLAGAARLIKWVAVTVLTVIMLGFTAYLTISGIITGTADAAATKMTKTALGTMLPVVGGIISDAAGTILAGASMLRNAAGVFGMLAVLAICLLPFLKLSVHYLCYKAAAGISLAVADSRTAALTADISSAFGVIMGMTGGCAIMAFLSVISLLQGVGAV